MKIKRKIIIVKDVRSDPEWSRITPEWKGVDNKNGEQPWP